ncbi:MAG: right-handed parallel beta-helix repeat-containing protein, partial [archaeon]|nr:right-handed parallel beta-helix repeat-containing protein [archaeon]
YRLMRGNLTNIVLAAAILLLFLAGCTEPVTPQCGDGTCSQNENWKNCPADCEKPLNALCGDKICESGEENSCPSDCPEVEKCGDGICDAKESANPNACPKDCAPQPKPPRCQNDVCEEGETCETCQADCGACAVGNEFFVSKQGSDFGNGSEQNPWLTIQKAAMSAKPGATVYVKEGTYKESVMISASGTEQKRITFSAFPGDDVSVKATACNAFSVDADYITIKGFNISDAIFRKGQDCVDWTAAGISTDKSNNIFEDNEIHDSMYGIMIRGGIGEELHYPVEGNNLVRGNYIHDTNYAALRVKRSNNNVVENNTFENNATELDAFRNKNGDIVFYPEGNLVFYCLKNLAIRNNTFTEPSYGPAILEIDMVTRTGAPPSMAPNEDATKCYEKMDGVTITGNSASRTNSITPILLTLGRDFAAGTGHEIENNSWSNDSPGSQMVEWGYNFWHDNDSDDAIIPHTWSLEEFSENTGFENGSAN